MKKKKIRLYKTIFSPFLTKKIFIIYFHLIYTMSDEIKKIEFQDKVRKLLSGEDTSTKRSRPLEDTTSIGDIKGIANI
jgi:hypothetical protein